MSKRETVRNLFNEFLVDHDDRRTNELWKSQSEEFRTFWKDKIMASGSSYFDKELNRIIRILDVKGRRDRNEADVEGAAFVQIYQGDWEDIFSGIKENQPVKEKINTILTSNDDSIIINAINELQRINPIKKLTGVNAVVINDLLFAYNPSRYTSVMSLHDRNLIIDYFGLGNSSQLREKTYGDEIVESNRLVVSLGRIYGLQASARTQAEFLYSTGVKALWREGDPYLNEIIGAIAFIKFGDTSGVYSDKYIEEFSRGEWDYWNTPKDYMRGGPGILLLYDPDRSGITIQAEVKSVQKQGEGNFPYKNRIDPDSTIIFEPPISKESIRRVPGLESFARGQTPKYNLQRHMLDALMNNYNGNLRSRNESGQAGRKQFSLQKDDDGIRIVEDGDGVDPQTSKSVVVTRLFQSAFRNSILKLFDHKCLFCDVDSDLLLEAAHIKPFKTDYSTAGDFANGLALCTIHHKLFDNGLVSIKDGEVIPSKELLSLESDFLNEQYNELYRLPSVSLPKREKSEEYLKWHYNNVFDRHLDFE